MNELLLERKRTGWDIVFGVLLIIAAFFVLGHVVLATIVSVLFIGWLTLISGVIALVGALFRIGKGGFWPAAVTGGLLTVLGIMFVRNPGLAAVTLTLVAGSFFLASGIIRVVAAFQTQAGRWILLLGGIVSVILGLIVLFNLFTATLTLLGILLAVELLDDGITLLLMGRVRVTER